ncbi:putative calcium-transporting ATPase 11, plasma membrane-type [Camellia lanceoleosa]|uniref:Calcium-transporting ATPase 11, plasma membrane-type n=1 Tax=Camellia lanceoleosa TaxID=1840588 RepID=A0ACC0G860_9ERIC|nr:putative calcium-transporting ATPase 11, plasma membrane-type [Camellia lanceoleosa]
MEEYLKENFQVPPKNPSEEVLERWRKLCRVVRNPRRRFRFTANLSKRHEADAMRPTNQEELRVLLYVNKAANQFLHDFVLQKYKPPEEVKKAGFDIDADKLSSLVSSRNYNDLRRFLGVEEIARCLKTSLDNGISTLARPPLHVRKSVFGFNIFVNKPHRSLFTFTWEAMQDMTFLILMECATVSMVLGTAIEGWPKGMYDGFGIILCILLAVMIMAISDYKQHLQFHDLNEQKKKTFILVTRDGVRQKLSIYELVVGDVVHLFTGDQVPADGIYISGYNLLVDESSLTGESEPVNINEKNPFLLSGTKVQDGSGKMLVASVGMRTDWGKLMVTLSQSGENETPLQVKLNGIASIAGKICLTVSILTFLVLTARLMVGKALCNEFLEWSRSDALKLLNYIAVAVTVLVVGVPQGLPLAVMLSLTFSVRKLMNERVLLKHLSPCETMASGVLDILLQSIYLNCGSEIVQGKDGKKTIFGSPTESALLEFAFLLGGDFTDQCQQFKILQVRNFNSLIKKRSVLVACPEGGSRAFCTGAAEIILKGCNKIVCSNGESMHFSEEQKENILDIIKRFCCGALRTLCLAFKDINDSSDCKVPDDDYTLIAIVGISDPLRPEVKNAVQTCLAAGITVRMVTGDNINTAKAVAKECGILTDDGLAIEGPDFRSKSPAELEELIPNIQVVARSSPDDKYTLVTYLKSTFRETVAVTGDGTNDAPALQSADVGLAMEIAGTEVAREAADVVLMDDNFATIVNLVKWGRSVYQNVQQFVQFQLTINIVAVVFNFVSACFSGSAPLTAVQLLWVNVISDILGVLPLVTELPSDQLEERALVGTSTKIITNAMWRNIVGQSIYQLAILCVLKFDGKRLLKLSGEDAGCLLDTVIFNSFVLFQPISIVIVVTELKYRYHCSAPPLLPSTMGNATANDFTVFP